MKIRVFDVLAIVFSSAVVAVSSLYAYTGKDGVRQVRIEASGEEYIFPIDSDRTVEIEGPRGTTTVRIEGGRASVLDSPCPDKLCVLMGPIAEPGQWVACLPNRVFVRIWGTVGEEVDGAAF
jgi:hypothetical protein